MIPIGYTTLVGLYRSDAEPRVYYAEPPPDCLVVAVVAAKDKTVRAGRADADQLINRAFGSRVLYFCVPRDVAERLGLL